MGPAPFRRPCISGAGDDVPVGGFIGHGAVRGPGGASIRARRLEGVFDAAGTPSNEPPVDVKTLHAKIGQLTLENNFLSEALGKAGLLSAKR